MPIASSTAPRLVALIGGSGFIGTAVTEAFASAGWRVLALCRTPDNARHLKPLGDLGQIGAKKADVRTPASLYAGLENVDAVVNLVGINAEKGGQSFKDIHIKGAANVAAASAARGVQALVHVSALGADANSDIPFARTKGEGEAAVRAAFPAATIIRPGVVFGANDNFTNRIAQAVNAGPAIPVVAPDAIVQPIWVQDVAQAIFQATIRQIEGESGATYELVGPHQTTLRQLVEFVAAEIGIEKPMINTPAAGGRLLASLGLKAAPASVDAFDMLSKGIVADGQTPGLADFGIEASSLETLAPQWLVRYLDGGRFSAIL